jgi:hypothetical protein
VELKANSYSDYIALALGDVTSFSRNLLVEGTPTDFKWTYAITDGEVQ